MKATEEHKKKMREYRKNHKEKYNEYQKKYYQTHREYYINYSKKKYNSAKYRIEKAIEYIEQLPFSDLVPLEVKIIYGILKGSDSND